LPPRTLHITNGTSIIPRIRDAGIPGAIVPWEDVLHEGPVPAGLGVAAMRERRADFLAACGWDARARILRMLAERDSVLEQATTRGVDEIVLWLEHDLHDQLQLLQILERLPLGMAPRLSAVPDDTYLGSIAPEQFSTLFAARREITSAERIAARDAWDAFRSPDPRPLLDLLPRVTVLKHLGAALLRHLQQFPSIDNGLSRTEQQTFEAIAAGHHLVRDVYQQANHEREDAVFMGDAAFKFHITALFAEPRPLLKRLERVVTTLTLDERIDLTDDGRRVLDGAIDRVTVTGIDRWLGGVYLKGHGPVWRWDPRRQTVRMA
jgi:hypothetical protein